MTELTQVWPMHPDYPVAMTGPPFNGCEARNPKDAHSGICAEGVWWCIWARIAYSRRPVSHSPQSTP